MTSYSENLNKAVGLPLDADPEHEYVFRSGEYGPVYQYWWRDRKGNYWLYSNAPVGHKDHYALLGEPLIVAHQPMSHTTPAYFNKFGFKRHMAVPAGIETEFNHSYNRHDPTNLWTEIYTTANGAVRYVYLDRDVKENLDLYVQHQVRVADAQLMGLRNLAVELFNGHHPKDRIAGAMMMLIDQAFFVPENLTVARVSDLEYIDNTIKLFGRKFLCDHALFDFLSSIHVGRDPNEPLFAVDTYHGRRPLGIHYLYSLFRFARVSPKFLHYLQANKVYSRVMNRLSYEKVPLEQANDQALSELARVIGTKENVAHLVDLSVKRHVLEKYQNEQQEEQQEQEPFQEEMEKSLLTFEDADHYAVPYVSSKLVELTPAEQEFSQWLHSQPLHDASPEQEAKEAQMAPKTDVQEDQPQEEEQPQQQGQQADDEGAPEGDFAIREGKGAEPIPGGGSSGL